MRILALLILLGASRLFAGEWTASPHLDRAMEEAVASRTIPGGVLLVGQGDRILHHKAYGSRSLLTQKTPATLDTIYDCASLTKVVATAPSIMTLVEEGRVRLSDRVTKYLPEFRGGDSPITVRQLLTHYSGLRPDLDLQPVWSGYETGIEKAYREVPVAKPDEKFIYSDINFILLAEIVRQVGGKPLDRYATERIFQPLGMRETRFRPPATLLSRIAPTEKLPDGTLLHGVVHDPTTRYMGGLAGHAGLFSTAADLSRFARMILERGELDGARVLSPLGVEAMARVQSPEGKPERGLGWDLDSPYASPRGDLYPKTSFGHTGFTGTSMWIDPGTDSYVILMTNRVHPSAGSGSVVSLRSRIASIAAAGVSTMLAGAPPDRAATGDVQTGLDTLVAEDFARLRGMRIGLITNHTGIDRQGRSNVELIRAQPDIELAAIFTPEHGFEGQADAGESVASSTIAGQTPVYSLYQPGRRRPSQAMLSGLDALVFDIQDAGARFYTYATTLAYCLEAAAEAGLPVYVLDRPNPITGTRIEGPSLDADLKSFIGYLPGMPVRHGMTIGELALLFNEVNAIGAGVHVVKMQGWRREMWFDETGLPWVNPSPNLRNLTQAALYPGVAMLEGLTSLSVGRGTDAPFEFVGAPWFQAERYAAKLNHGESVGVRAEPATRRPESSVFAGKEIPGLELRVTDRDRLEPTGFIIALAALIGQYDAAAVDWTETARLIGDRNTVELLRAGAPAAEIEAAWGPGIAQFAAVRSRFLLYP